MARGAAADLAGYRVVFGSAAFDPAGPLPPGRYPGDPAALSRQPRVLVPYSLLNFHCALAAIDRTGNVSSLSPAGHITVPGGVLPVAHFGLALPAGAAGEPYDVLASGSDLLWDFDLNGDGSFERTGSVGSESFTPGFVGLNDMTALGRAGGMPRALLHASLLLRQGAGSPPDAVASAEPASGAVPLEVTLTGNADDPDDDIATYSWDYDGDGFCDDTWPEPPGPQVYTYTTTGDYLPSFRVEDTGGNVDVAQAEVQVGPDTDNLAPVAVITCDPCCGQGESTFTFDAGASFDTDGQIVEYEWKASSLDEEWVSTGTTPSFEATYPPQGVSYACMLRVTDDDGAQHENYTFVVADVLWSAPETLTPGGAADYISSATLAPNSYTAFAYCQDGDVYFLAALDLDATAWHGPELVASGYNATVCSLTSYAAPATQYIAFNDSVNVDVYVLAHEEDAGWQPPMLVDSAGDLGDYLSIAAAPAELWHLIYYDATNGDLKLAQPEVDGFDIQTWDSAGDVGQFCTLVYSPFYSALWAAYYDATNGDLKFIDSMGQVPGADAGIPLVLDSTGDVGQYPSIALHSSSWSTNNRGMFPAISYYDATNADLKFITAGWDILDDNALGWLGPVTLDTAGDVGRFSQCRDCYDPGWNNELFYNITYWDATNQQLRYVRSLTPWCWQPQFWCSGTILQDATPVFNAAYIEPYNSNKVSPLLGFSMDGDFKVRRYEF